jgi:hypothetical protein
LALRHYAVGFFIVSLAACASVWGFEDAHDIQSLADSGLDDEVVPAEGAEGVVCVPRPPSDLRGPLIVSEITGFPLAPLAGCPERYEAPFDLFANPKADGCKCGCDAKSVKCSAPVLNVYNAPDVACVLTPCGTLSVGSACTAYPPPGCTGDNTNSKIATPSGPEGKCAVEKTDLVKGWSASARVCSPSAGVPGKCPDGKIPTPAAPPPYEPNYCVLAVGAVACPAKYPAQRVYFTTLSDDVTCNCDCGAPSGGSCNRTIQAQDHGPPACDGAQKPTPVSTCTAMGNTSGIFVDGGAAPPIGAKCEPLGGIDGGFHPDKAYTLCCRH